jgi:hypothetical protein
MVIKDTKRQQYCQVRIGLASFGDIIMSGARSGYKARRGNARRRELLHGKDLVIQGAGIIPSRAKHPVRISVERRKCLRYWR